MGEPDGTARHGDRESYLRAMQEAAQPLVASGNLLPEAAQTLANRAREGALPKGVILRGVVHEQAVTRAQPHPPGGLSTRWMVPRRHTRHGASLAQNSPLSCAISAGIGDTTFQCSTILPFSMRNRSKKAVGVRPTLTIVPVLGGLGCYRGFAAPAMLQPHSRLPALRVGVRADGQTTHLRSGKLRRLHAPEAKKDHL
ncbi:hypothetical protein SAMN05877809_1103 [Rhodobacter sp. JA431]|uniref:hypothetical protein n=1 Tax=Rhodobacter sp. JA431 TaxID=570013 RepID=UPI000BD4AFF1|nr:hypothetical protein [Rhodobacter sp. JA431]SOC18561.1 hypothetical protein SAMN05877809_1103 [Rhodobacter sp. JA431]